MYAELPGYEELRRVLNGKLAEYNETNTSMDLVLFQQANTHRPHHLCMELQQAQCVDMKDTVDRPGPQYTQYRTGYGACMSDLSDHLHAARERHAGRRGRIWEAKSGAPCLLHLRLRGKPFFLSAKG